MAKEVKKNSEANYKLYFLMLASFVAGFLLATIINSSSGPNVQKQALGSGSSIQGMNQDDQLLQHIKEEELKVQQTPNDPALWGHLGDLYYDTRQYQKAVDAYTKSLAIKPGNLSYMTDMGTMYRALDQFENSLAQYDQVLAINPKHVNARFNRGIVLIFDLGRKEEGLNTWKILVSQEPNTKAPDGRLLSEIIKEMEQQN